MCQMTHWVKNQLILRILWVVIIFQPDSTFHANRLVPFLEDTVGVWDAGTCGFESSGKLRFKHTPVVIDFSPYNENDSMFAIIGSNGKDGRPHYYWFKKQPGH